MSIALENSKTNLAQTSAWKKYTPNDKLPWNLKRVVHLHRRAALGADWNKLQDDLASEPQDAVGRLLKGTSTDRQISEFETLAETIGDAAMTSGNPGRLKAWWIYRMLMTPDPLGERLTLMWHNHFATSNRKVKNLVFMREQNGRIRKHARGPFEELLAAVVKHPAMMIWLDADSNRKGSANENLARELLELFTLGVGNYSETDVKAAAIALTGWTLVQDHFEFREKLHDDAEVNLLNQSGTFTGDELLGILVDNPATARRIAWRICDTFMGEGVVNESALKELAEGLVASNLDINGCVETVLRSELFFSEANMGTRVLGPAEFVVGAIRALELIDTPPSTLLLAEWVSRMGQNLFYPPNVGGWRGGRGWLGSRTVIARANFATALVSGSLWHPARAPDIGRMCNRHSNANGFVERVGWIIQLLWGESPEDIVNEIAATEKNGSIANAVAMLLSRPEHQLA